MQSLVNYIVVPKINREYPNIARECPNKFLFLLILHEFHQKTFLDAFSLILELFQKYIQTIPRLNEKLPGSFGKYNFCKFC